MKGCPWLFRSHACDLMDGHPTELGHICLHLENELIPDNGSEYCTRYGGVTFSSICMRVESDDKELFL